jgi:biotin carboxyl carrier protein
MKFKVTVGGERQEVELRRQGTGWDCVVNGEARAADVAEVAPGTFSLLLDGRSFTVSVERSGKGYRVHSRGADLLTAVENPRRWSGRDGGGLGLSGRQEIGAPLSGRQEIGAPMPGKIVRVLVQEGQEVQAGQGVVVVEAMKMQNEIPAPKQGVVERVSVREGDTVEHGTVLLVVA